MSAGDSSLLGVAAYADVIAIRDAVQTLVEARRVVIVDRVEVLAEADSTQDEARRMCSGRAGLVVIAGRQSLGRGRLGRRWLDEKGQSLAATFVLDGGAIDNGRAAMIGGIAACRVLQLARESLDLGASNSGVSFGLRWPNDVVVAGVDGAAERTGRKVAGVLVERTGQLLMMGIGINVRQRAEDWPAEIRGSAVSLGEVCGGVEIGRPEVAAALCVALDEVSGWSDAKLCAWWTARDTLVGRRASFVVGNVTHNGIVRAVDPVHQIRLEVEGEGLVELPAMQASLVHGSVR